ncbi:MAG: hypothetical protein L6R42_001359 [Xanthoria sp. 1 TBL-2021]|nr:MAG: hypothetical protein L6R42_001359 [Xanthoria sp. 1 TBL-2021]
MDNRAVDEDPFVDPVHPHPHPRPHLEQRQRPDEDSTLIAGRTASLTLGTDSLIVLDEGFAQRQRWSCCGLLRNESKTTHAIPFYNILWAELSQFEISIRYARPTTANVVRVSTINCPVEKPNHPRAISWVEHLLDRAYGESQRKKRIKLLVNPFGGQGKAQKWYLRDIEPIFAAARCEVDFQKTQYQGHAVEIAEKLDADAFDVIAACSGDGLPHEIINGLGKKVDARRALRTIAVVQLPCGTGNAMSWNLNGTDSPSLAALAIVKGIKTPLDLVSITQGGRRTLSFLSQAVGIIADADLATEHLRWLGSARFTYGVLIRLMRKTVYPCDLALKIEVATKAEVREHYRQALNVRSLPDNHRDGPSLQEAADEGQNLMGLPELRYGTVNEDLPEDWTLVPYDKLGNFWCGNMAFMSARNNPFPGALPNDGCMDLVTIDGDINRLKAIQCISGVETGKFFDLSHVNYRKISGYRIIPRNQKDGYISIDGERMPFEPFQAEVHRGLGTVLSKSGHVYEAPGVVSKNGESAS